MQTDVTDAVPATQPSRRGLVIALHCSGGGAGQWRRLGCELGADYELVAPEHYGCDSIGAWTGEHTFTLADEAARTIALIDRCDRQVHLGLGSAIHLELIRKDARLGGDFVDRDRRRSLRDVRVAKPPLNRGERHAHRSCARQGGTHRTGGPADSRPCHRTGLCL